MKNRPPIGSLVRDLLVTLLVLQYAFVVCLLITVTSIQRKSEKSRRARIMEFKNGAGLEGYRNPETSSPTHGSYPYLALAQS